jgi:hypothetical protein
VSAHTIAMPTPHTTRGALQGTPHTPATQFCPVGQAVLQAPQWARSSVVSTHCPPQSVWPARHTQAPTTQL